MLEGYTSLHYGPDMRVFLKYKLNYIYTATPRVMFMSPHPRVRTVTKMTGKRVTCGYFLLKSGSTLPFVSLDKLKATSPCKRTGCSIGVWPTNTASTSEKFNAVLTLSRATAAEHFWLGAEGYQPCRSPV